MTVKKTTQRKTKTTTTRKKQTTKTTVKKQQNMFAPLFETPQGKRILEIIAEQKGHTIQDLYRALDADALTHNTSGIYDNQLRFTLKDNEGKEYSFAVTDTDLQQDKLPTVYPLVWSSAEAAH